jgi:acyl-CoA thioesterase-1
MYRALICFIFAVFTAACAPTPQIVAFGDSLTAGFGADPGKSYPDYLQALLDKSGYRYHVVNAGVSGDTTSDGVERMQGVLQMHPAIVILEFGANDGLRGMPPSTTRTNLEKMVVDLQKAGAKVILAGMTLPRNYGAEFIHSFEQVYVELAIKYKLTRIPFLLDGVVLAGPGLMQQDGMHATAAGNAKVAATVYKYLQPLLKR